MYNEGKKTFTAGEALAEKRNVRIKTGTTTTPPEVVYADAGEDGIGVTEFAVAITEPVTVKLWSNSGTFEVEVAVSAAIAKGTVLYAANDGKLSDASIGSVAAVALEDGVTGQQIEVYPQSKKSTTAALVSILDSLGLITAGTVEAALAEIMTGIKTAQNVVLPSLICKEDGTALTVFADGVNGVGWTQLSAKDLALRWNNQATPDDIAVQFVMPQDYNDAANVVLHMMGAIIKAGALVDSPKVTVEAYFSEVGAAPGADADCGGDSTEFTADGLYEEGTLTIALANAPAAPCVLTCILHPKDGELGTDDFVMLTPWLEVTRKCLTS
jgi:hypothetical protein